ncbi:hypothetical protein [Streptomyces sp. NPDC051921]|uniref:hypothetical protein n=1 Tax=Streptomyces sp. NPDC051921 TaxID=3155806 RepID=UPI0034219760
MSADGCGRGVVASGLSCIAWAQSDGRETGACPGYDGPCGRAVQTSGLCGRCLITAEKHKAAADAEWEAAREAAITAAREAETTPI